MREVTQEMKTEIKQVTAVGFSMMEDLRFGQASTDKKFLRKSLELTTQGAIVRDNVIAERRAQDGKWGPQHHDPLVWLAILMEEVGEFAEELELLRSDDESLHIIRNNTVRIGQEAKQWLQTVYEPDGGLEPV